jgi:Uma2 family endonuclease
MVKPPAPSEPFVTLAPDWVCEVLSPSTALHDRARKLAVYAREGVAHAWLIDPLLRSLEVYRREPEGWLLRGVFGRDEVCRPEPFDALPLELGALWLPTEPAAP